MFDGFWQIVIDDFGSITHSMENDTRQTYARTYLTGICRDVSMPLSVDLMIELCRARGKPTYDTVWCRFDQVLASREEQPDHPIESAQQIGDAYAGRDDQLEPSEQPDHRPALPDPRGRPDAALSPVYPKYRARTPRLARELFRWLWMQFAMCRRGPEKPSPKGRFRAHGLDADCRTWGASARPTCVF